MKKGLFFLFLIFLVFSRVCFSQGVKAQWAPENKVLLENEFFRLIFEPNKSGSATEVVSLPWNSHITAKSGFFIDSFREIGVQDGLFDFGFLYPDYLYQAEILTSSENEAKIRLSLKIDAIDKNYNGWILQREYTLKKGEPFIYACVRMINGGSETRRFAYRPSHLVNFENETVWYYIPGEYGVLRDYDPPIGSDGRGSHGLYTLYPSGSWIGCLSDKSHHGLVFEFDWKHLDSIEVWISSRAGSVAQWFYRIFTLSPGQTWETNYVIYPVEELLNISGAKSGVVCSISIGKDEPGKPLQTGLIKPNSKVPVKFQIYSPISKKLQYKIFEKIGENSRLLKQEEIEIKAFSKFETETIWDIPSGDLLAVIEVEITEKGKKPWTIAQPVEIGRCIEIYQAKRPDEKQSGESAGYVHRKPPVPEEVKKIDLSFVSPHQQWAKPYIKGKTKMLFVYRCHSLVHLREIVQRGDFDISLLATVPSKPYEQLKDLPERIKNFSPDVIFFTAFDWTGFPAGVTRVISNWVQRGGGLVIDANLSDQRFLPVLEMIKQGTKISPKTVLINTPFSPPELELYQLGEGRIVILKGGVIVKGDNLPIGEWRPNPWMPGWEYNYPYLISAILWSAGKQMPVNFKPVVFENSSYQITICNHSLTGKLKAKIEIRNQYNELYKSQQISFSPFTGETTVPLAKIDELQEGMSVAKILVFDNKNNVAGWTSVKLERPSTVKTQIVCNSAFYKNEPIQIKTDIVSQETENIKGILTIKDAWERTVWQSEFLKPGSYNFSPDTRLFLDIWHQIILRVYKNEKLLSEKRQLLFVFPEKNIPDDDFSIGCWGHPYGNPSGAVVSTPSAVENGIQYFYSYGGEMAADHVYRNHGRIYGPPNTNPNLFMSTKIKKKDPVSLKTDPPLFPDQKEWEKTKADVIKKTKDYVSSLGANVMMLDDERDLKGDFDWSETTLSHFPEWLKKEYGTIEKLNSVWATNYKSFEEVRPKRKEEVKEDNLASYLDYRKYNGWIVEEFYTRQPLLWVKEADPKATIGMHGIYTTSSNRPWDMSKIIPMLSITGRYDGILEEWFRTMGRTNIHGQYTGYQMAEKLTYENRITPWKNLFHNSRWILYYQMRNLIGDGGIFQSIINYDGTVRPIYRQLYKEELKEIQEGIGKLVLNSKLVDDGIVFTYSYTSCLMNSHISSYFAAKTIVEQLGYQHTLISYKELEDYKIPENAKVIFLSDCISMSPSEIESIKRFVSSGGIVVADTRTAIYDNHGVMYRVSPLDEVFGIDRKEKSFAPEKKKLSGSDSFVVWVAEPGLKITGSAQALFKTEDGTPVVVMNSYGKGKAIYLNLHLPPYSSISGAGAAGEIVIEQPGAAEIIFSYKKIFERIFADICGIVHRVKIEPQDLVKETFLFSCPENKSYFLGLLPSTGIKNESRLTLILPEEKFVYDVRDRKLIGKGTKIQLMLKPEKASLFALLPYSVKKITVAGQDRCYQGQTISFRGKIITSNGFADGHILRIEFFDSKNNKIPFWAQKIKPEGIDFDFSIPVDLTMAPGTYKVVVTDIISGVNGNFVFKVLKK